MYHRLLFVALIVGCTVGTSYALNCFQCTSLDPGCDEKDRSYLQNCTEDKSGSCRYIRQTVDNEVRIVRQCSSLTQENVMRCFDKVGANKIKVIYCQCREDGCNSGVSVAAHFGSLILIVALAKGLLV